MNNLLRKSVVQKGVRDMAVLGLGLAVTVGFAPVTTWAGFQNPKERSCRFNAQSQDSHLMRVSAGERIIMARGGNGSGGGRSGGSGMGQRGDDTSESGYRWYGPGDGTGTGEGLGNGIGYGAKKGAGTGDCDGTGPKGKGRGKGRN